MARSAPEFIPGLRTPGISYLCILTQLAAWLIETHGCSVSQGTISNTLRKGNKSFPLESGAVKRQREAEWPNVEKALYEWILSNQAKCKNSRFPMYFTSNVCLQYTCSDLLPCGESVVKRCLLVFTHLEVPI